jgi:hypothetical protein
MDNDVDPDRTELRVASVGGPVGAMQSVLDDALKHYEAAQAMQDAVEALRAHLELLDDRALEMLIRWLKNEAADRKSVS